MELESGRNLELISTSAILQATTNVVELGVVVVAVVWWCLASSCCLCCGAGWVGWHYNYSTADETNELCGLDYRQIRSYKDRVIHSEFGRNTLVIIPTNCQLMSKSVYPVYIYMYICLLLDSSSSI